MNIWIADTSEYQTFTCLPFRCPVIVCYSSHSLNTKLKVCYSSHDLNTELKVCYSSHQSRNLSVKQPMTWIANYWFIIQAMSLITNLVCYSSHDLNNKPFKERTVLDHSNTELLCYSYPPCTVTIKIQTFEYQRHPNAALFLVSTQMVVCPNTRLFTVFGRHSARKCNVMFSLNIF